jgi:ketosteroid isomerase-like protein
VSDSGVTAARGLYIAFGVALLAALLAWAAAGVDVADLKVAGGWSVKHGATEVTDRSTEEQIRASVQTMDAALRRGDRAGFAAFYADPALAVAALTRIGAPRTLATETLALEPREEDWMQAVVLVLTFPPGAARAQVRLEMTRIWMQESDGLWRIRSEATD